MINTTPIKMPSRGYYSLSKVDSAGNPRPEGCPKNITDNVITYEGAYYSLIQVGIFGGLRCAMGTGATERTRSSTSLDIPVSGRTPPADAGRGGNEADNADGTSTLTLTRKLSFTLGSKVGTFSEVGLYTGSSAGTFIAGQLIKDEFGNPTTVTVLSDEQLVVTYTLEWTVPNGEGTTPIIGTGSVTTPEGSSTYNIYSMPYFAEYDIGSSIEVPRMGSTACFAQNTAGTVGKDFPRESSWTEYHDGAGTATIESSLFSVPPSGFTSSDIRFIASGGDIWSASEEKFDDVTKKSISNRYVTYPSIVEFTPALIKTSDMSLSIQFSQTFLV